MSHVSLPQLAKKSGKSRRHLQRLAASGGVPGAIRSASGIWSVPESAALNGWLAAAGMKAIKRESLSCNIAYPVVSSGRRFIRALLAVTDSGKPIPKDIIPLIEGIAMFAADVLQKADAEKKAKLSAAFPSPS